MTTALHIAAGIFQCLMFLLALAYSISTFGRIVVMSGYIIAKEPRKVDALRIGTKDIFFLSILWTVFYATFLF